MSETVNFKILSLNIMRLIEHQSVSLKTIIFIKTQNDYHDNKIHSKAR